MLRRLGIVWAAIVCLAIGPAMAQPKPVTLWHVFNLETDMIYGGIKSFNETQTAYRIDARLVPANQLVAELIKAIATGSVPDLVTLDNPFVASFSAQGSLLDLTDRVGRSKLIKPDVYFKGPWASGIWKSRIFAVPRDANTLALCYNADMFRAKGLDPAEPPKTWSELTADAAKLKDPGEERVRLRLQRDAGARRACSSGCPSCIRRAARSTISMRRRPRSRCSFWWIS